MKMLSGSLKDFASEKKVMEPRGSLAPNGGLRRSTDSSDRNQVLNSPTPAELSSSGRSTLSPQHDPELEGQLSVGHGVCLKGTIKECRVLSIRGDVEADIECDRLVIDENGRLEGSIISASADVGGNFSGTASVKGEVLIRSTGCLSGELSYGSIRIELGGKVRGKFSDSCADNNVSTEDSGARIENSEMHQMARKDEYVVPNSGLAAANNSIKIQGEK